jgi:hypothetical protein
MGGTSTDGEMLMTGTSTGTADVAGVAASPCCPPSSSFVPAAACHSHQFIPVMCVNASVLSAVSICNTCYGTTRLSEQLNTLACALASGSAHVYECCSERAHTRKENALANTTCFDRAVCKGTRFCSAYLTGSGCCRDQSDGASACGIGGGPASVFVSTSGGMRAGKA